MTASRQLVKTDHHHPAGMRCVACIVAGIDVAPSSEQAAHLRLVQQVRGESRKAAS